MIRYSVKLTVAEALGIDVADLEKQHRYQPTRTPCMVYATDEGYFTAAKVGKKPREVADNLMGNWRWKKAKTPPVAASRGWQIYQSINGE